MSFAARTKLANHSQVIVLTPFRAKTTSHHFMFALHAATKLKNESNRLFFEMKSFATLPSLGNHS